MWFTNHILVMEIAITIMYLDGFLWGTKHENIAYSRWHERALVFHSLAKFNKSPWFSVRRSNKVHCWHFHDDDARSIIKMQWTRERMFVPVYHLSNNGLWLSGSNSFEESIFDIDDQKIELFLVTFGLSIEWTDIKQEKHEKITRKEEKKMGKCRGG